MFLTSFESMELTYYLLFHVAKEPQVFKYDNVPENCFIVFCNVVALVTQLQYLLSVFELKL